MAKTTLLKRLIFSTHFHLIIIITPLSRCHPFKSTFLENFSNEILSIIIVIVFVIVIAEDMIGTKPIRCIRVIKRIIFRMIFATVFQFDTSIFMPIINECFIPRLERRIQLQVIFRIFFKKFKSFIVGFRPTKPSQFPQ